MTPFSHPWPTVYVHSEGPGALGLELRGCNEKLSNRGTCVFEPDAGTVGLAIVTLALSTADVPGCMGSGV